jgi:hypothetical protein
MHVLQKTILKMLDGVFFLKDEPDSEVGLTGSFGAS